MRQRPFVLQDVVVDLQRREWVAHAETKGRTDLTFHAENPDVLHFREIGKDVGMRCEIDNGQLWSDVFNRERNNTHAHFGGAALAHGEGVKTELQRRAFNQIVVQTRSLQLSARIGFVIDNPDLLPGETGRVLLRKHQINLAVQLKLHAVGDFHRAFATDGQL